jgi:hypothetical protein
MRPLLLSLALPAVCLAQAPKPVLTFAKLHHDFGKVAVDRKVSHRFKATNTGMAPLQIKQVVPSCGCTYTLVGQWYLKPGESTEIEATFNPAGMRGVVRKSMQVVSDDPVNPTITLSFEAEVIQEIMPSTTALFFDEVLRNSPARKASLRLDSGNGQAVQVIDAKAPGAPYLSATFRSEGKDVLVEVSLDARKVPPTRSSGVDVLTIRTTSERMALIPINIQWTLRPSVLATPSRVAWVETSGKDLRSVVTLKHADGRAFRILSAKTTHPLLRAEGIGKSAGLQQEIAVVLGSQAKAGSYNERVILTLDDPDQPEMEIRVSAILR